MWPALANSPILLSRIPRRWLIPLAVSAALAIVFPDLALTLILNLLHALWFVAHAIIGWVELSIEHLLEWSLGVSRHTAQILTAWIGLFLILTLLVWLIRRYTAQQDSSR